MFESTIADLDHCRPTHLQVNCQNLCHIYLALKDFVGGRQVMAILKANAYGHGVIEVAHALESVNADYFGVAYVEEGCMLRRAGIQTPILVLGGIIGDQIPLFLRENLDITASSIDKLKAIDACAGALGIRARVHLKIDTGMHRLGFQPAQAQSISQQLRADGIKTVVAMSHLAAAETPDSDLSVAQKTTWNAATASWEGETSLHNSAATLLATPARSVWARIGYALYGGQIEGLKPNARLKPAMTLASSVLATRRIAQGDSVGYGGRWTAGRESVIATVPVGYGDGYPWAAADGTPVAIGEHLVPLAGRVSMDMITIDVTDCGEISHDMPVTLWGNQPHVDTVARHAGTIGYELMTRLTQRTPRHYI